MKYQIKLSIKSARVLFSIFIINTINLEIQIIPIKAIVPTIIERLTYKTNNLFMRRYDSYKRYTESLRPVILQY